jgi:hypothetical protein
MRDLLTRGALTNVMRNWISAGIVVDHTPWRHAVLYCTPARVLDFLYKILPWSAPWHPFYILPTCTDIPSNSTPRWLKLQDSVTFPFRKKKDLPIDTSSWNKRELVEEFSKAYATLLRMVGGNAGLACLRACHDGRARWHQLPTCERLCPHWPGVLFRTGKPTPTNSL